MCGRIWANYEAIGGASPLAPIAARIAEKLEDELEQRDVAMPVRVGMAYWHPLVAEAVGELADLGCERVVGVSLSPYESRAASGACRDALDRAAVEHRLEVAPSIPAIASLEAFAEAFAQQLSVALDSVSDARSTLVVFSAHSLPLDDLVVDDPYVSGLRCVASRVARACGLGESLADVPEVLPGVEAFGSAEDDPRWLLAYQSKGKRGGEWLGPDLSLVLEAASQGDVSDVIVVPIGFLTDHMETLYDLDIAAARAARALGMRFTRISPPNDDAKIISAIADEVERLLGKD